MKKVRKYRIKQIVNVIEIICIIVLTVDYIKHVLHVCPPHTVQNVQRACNAEGANIVVDGIPGKETIAAWVPKSQNWNEREIADRCE